MATFQGTWANAQLSYWGRSFVRGGPKHFGGGTVENLYENVISARCDDPTVRRSVSGVLACVLGREAAARRGRLTMEELLRENRRLEVDLKGPEA